jgi:hypothetical protein
MEEKKVLEFKLRAKDALKRIRDRASDSGNIIWGSHALERMEERGIVTQDVLRILRQGQIEGDLEATGRGNGEWKCKMTLRIRGARTAGVIVVMLGGGKLFVKTVEWEDGR